LGIALIGIGATGIFAAAAVEAEAKRPNLWLVYSLVGVGAALALLGVYLYFGAPRIRKNRTNRTPKDILLDNLGRKLTLGKHMGVLGSRAHYDSDAKYEEELEVARDRAKGWSRSVSEYIRDRMGYDQLALYESDHGLPERYDGPSSYLHTSEEIENFVARRCLRLEQIIVRLRGQE
jgi:hypothetical protein